MNTPFSTPQHHDYHDNLYIVLRGTKQLTLFAPSEHASMYTVGDLSKLHPNGRINYKGSITRADGSDASSEKALQASLELEKAMFSMEQHEVGYGGCVRYIYRFDMIIPQQQ